MNKSDIKTKGEVMKNCAFTLIELLVVVLIIGILAAIALPQYQKAVMKSRFAAAIPKVHAFEQGLREYYLANGHYKFDYDAFAVGEKWSDIDCTPQYCQMNLGHGIRIEMLNGSGVTTAQYYRVYCLASLGNTVTNSICSEYGQYERDNAGSKYYLMKQVDSKGTATYYGRSIPL